MILQLRSISTLALLFLLPLSNSFTPFYTLQSPHKLRTKLRAIPLNPTTTPSKGGTFDDRFGKETKVFSAELTEGEFLLPEGSSSPCIIKVLGIGGGGSNAVNRMVETSIQGVQFWGINTDAQALTKSLAKNRLNIGKKVTRGLGAGGNPEVGKSAAQESRAEIEAICRGSDLVFITAGMGGGTGSGAAPIVASIAKDCGCLTVGVVTKPFSFEGRRRTKQANLAIKELQDAVDTMIVVSNDKLLQIVPENTPVTDAFLVADDILRQGVVGISEIIIKPGLINVDFADVRTIMSNAGTALMGVGTGRGKNRAQDAAIAAISSPLLDFPIKRAKGIVFNVVGGKDLTLSEINSAAEVVYENADPEANIIFGALIDPKMEGEVSITVLATGFSDGGRRDSNDENGDVVATAKIVNGSKLLKDVDYNNRRNSSNGSKSPATSADDENNSIRSNLFKGGLTRDSKNDPKKPNQNQPTPPTPSTGVLSGFWKKLTNR